MMSTVRSGTVALGWVLLAACGPAALVGCAPASTEAGSATGSSRPAAATTATTAAATTATTTEPATTAAPGPPSPIAESWSMPDLVGRTLQEAQDEVQRLTDFGVFFTTSSDATGQGRAQLVDSNWVVCAQSVAPGTAITAGSRIEFSSVKVTERCP